MKVVSISFFHLWISTKKACWGCDSFEVIRWGRRDNKQRFRCKSCGLLFTWSNRSVSESNRFIWFRKWVIGRHTLEQLNAISGYSIRTLNRYFDRYLKRPPVLRVYPSERVNLIIDGTYFNNDLCLIVYRDNTIKFTQLYRLTTGEWYDELKEDIENLLALNVQIESITCDGHKSLLKAIAKACPNVMVQRCLVHIQRMCRIWLTISPKTIAGFQLRKIISTLHQIKTPLQRDYWIVDLFKWSELHKEFLNEKSFNLKTGRYWYKHKMVRRSFTVIKKALPAMFKYLENERIPKSTNGLESFFGHLKGHLAVHRGLSLNHRKNFISMVSIF